MVRLRSYASVVVVALLLVVGQLLLAPLSVSASPAGLPAPMTARLEPPAGLELLFVRQARGLQIYECQSGQWALRAPRAQLFDPETNQRVGIHYGGIDRDLNLGPWWESVRDGSRIRARVTMISPSPNPDSIPELQLDVVEWYGAGEFSPVTKIQRLNTMGGVGPAGACSANEQRRVVYTADYYFYGNP